MLASTAMLGLVPLLAPFAALASPLADAGEKDARLAARTADGFEVHITRPCAALLDKDRVPCDDKRGCWTARENPCVIDPEGSGSADDGLDQRYFVGLSTGAYPYTHQVGEETLASYGSGSAAAAESERHLFERASGLEAQHRGEPRFERARRALAALDPARRLQWIGDLVQALARGAGRHKGGVALATSALALIVAAVALGTSGHSMSATGTGIAAMFPIIILIIKVVNNGVGGPGAEVSVTTPGYPWEEEFRAGRPFD